MSETATTLIAGPPSQQSIQVTPYVSTLPYEMMKLTEDVFSSVIYNKFIKYIVGGKLDATIDQKQIVTLLKNYREDLIGKRNNQIQYTSDFSYNVLEKEALYYLLKNRISNLYYSSKEIKDASAEIRDISGMEQGVLDEKTKISKNRTLYILPNINSATKESITFNLNKDLIGKIRPYYESLFTSSSENLFFLNILSLENEDLDEFKSRLAQELERLKEHIKLKGLSDKTAYNQIIYFVDNEKDKSFNISYFTNSLKLKKEYMTELNSKLNSFFITGVGSQRLNLSNPLFSNIENLTGDIIIRGLKSYYKNSTDPKKTEINDILKDNSFKDALRLLIVALNDTYKRYTNVEYKKSLSQTINVNTFHIYSRFDNLDSAIQTAEITPSKDFLYVFLEKGHIPKLGYFQVSKESKQQYFFIVDAIENKRWKTDTDGEYVKYTKRFPVDKQVEKTQTKEDDDDEVEALEAIEHKSDAPETRRILVEIRYNYGRIEFKNIQTKLNTKFEGEIVFYKIKRMYEQYSWFKFNMIDHSLSDSNEIKYYEDTIFDIRSLKSYLQSENKYNDNTRLPYEFLKINSNIQDLRKYTDFIYDNFKDNINKNLKDDSFQEKIKKNIADIIFERNGLIYIRNTNTKSEKEKEKATADNYKVVNHKYSSVRSGTPLDTQLGFYFNKVYNEKKEETYIKGVVKDVKEEIKSLFGQPNKTGAFVVIQITKDVIADGAKLLLSAECKQRSKRIKSRYYRLFSFFKGGKKTTLKKKKRTRSKRYYRT